MSNPDPLRYGQYYHIYNRGNNRENLFIETCNYDYFLRLFDRYISPIAITLAYCLLRNHFHFFLQIKTLEEIQESIRIPETQNDQFPSLQFSHFFNAYTKGINKTYRRTGSLFEKPFKRIPVTTDAYFTHLIAYIHRNPQKHGLVNDFRLWPYSSYQEIRLQKPSRIQRDRVLDWFGGYGPFIEYHLSLEEDHQRIGYLVDDD